MRAALPCESRAVDSMQAGQAVLTSLSLGLLMGLERERRGRALAGLRTFALVALAGTVCAILGREAGVPWLLPLVAAGLMAMMIAAGRDASGPAAGADTTSTVALLLCFLFGALLAFGYLRLTVAMALATTALLYFKAELHDATARLTRQDIVSFLQFALITFVVLPVLPDEGYGPYGQLNPYRIWLMVVLTSAISLAGYATLRLARHGHAVPLLGVLGGLISSTATTLVFARTARSDPRQVPAATAVILIANLVLLVRIAVLTAVLAPSALPALGPVLGLGLLTGLAVPLRGWLRLAGSEARGALPELENPANLRQALAFGAVYGVVLVLSAALHARSGTLGLYALAAVSGTADMDALTISSLQLFKAGQIVAPELARAIVIALASNACIKALIVLVLAGRQAAAIVARNYLAAGAGLGAGVLLFL